METKTRTKTLRCAICKIRLQTLCYTCKCEKAFCANHLNALEHGCTFNYRADGLALLAKQMDVSGLAPKLEKL
jgi:hypothetical protein